MNILQIIEGVDKSDRNKTEPEWGDFAQILGLSHLDYNYDEFTQGLSGYHYAKWLCTDTYVGGTVYFLDGEAVAVSWQSARKSEEDINFLSLEAAEKVRQFMLDIGQIDQPEPPVMTAEEMVEDLGPGYKITFGSQVLNKSCRMVENDQPATIIETHHKYDEINRWQDVMVELEDGTKLEVTIDKIYFPWGC